MGGSAGACAFFFWPFTNTAPAKSKDAINHIFLSFIFILLLFSLKLKVNIKQIDLH
jgi:hypothetical protein